MVVFPRNFYSAISSTYFFMGGRYDAIDNQMSMDNWPFHTMMIIYFFFTVILMLNVLIGKSRELPFGALCEPIRSSNRSSDRFFLP